MPQCHSVVAAEAKETLETKSVCHQFQLLPHAARQRGGVAAQLGASMFRVVATRARRDLIAKMSALRGSWLGRSGGHYWTL